MRGPRDAAAGLGTVPLPADAAGRRCVGRGAGSLSGRRRDVLALLGLRQPINFADEILSVISRQHLEQEFDLESCGRDLDVHGFGRAIARIDITSEIQTRSKYESERRSHVRRSRLVYKEVLSFLARQTPETASYLHVTVFIVLDSCFKSTIQ